MKRPLLAIALLLAIGLSAAQAEKKHTVVFEATVVRIDTWGLMKFACGVAINYRLAEYKVDAIQSGHLTLGKIIVAKHLACNWNELDDLKVGDKVVVTAEFLKHPEKGSWHSDFQELPSDPASASAETAKTHDNPPDSGLFFVRCDVKKVVKLIYPSNPE